MNSQQILYDAADFIDRQAEALKIPVTNIIEDLVVAEEYRRLKELALKVRIIAERQRV